VVTDLLAGPFFYRRFVAHSPIPPNLVDSVIAQVLPAAPIRPTSPNRPRADPS
jgi:hypothetical protein